MNLQKFTTCQVFYDTYELWVDIKDLSLLAEKQGGNNLTFEEGEGWEDFEKNLAAP